MDNRSSRVAIAIGFAFPEGAVDDKVAAERHCERLLALYERRLTSMALNGHDGGQVGRLE